MTVSVIGLGKLGAPIAAVLASRGLTVIGADLDERKVAALGAGRAPVLEPGLDDLLERCQGGLSATTDIAAAVAASDLTLVVVPTPSAPDGGFSLEYVLAACAEIGRAIGGQAHRHTVSITSTVMPGATGGPIREALEAASGKRCGADFGLCYSPEFVALGSVIRNLVEPDFILIGESDAEAGDAVDALYRRVSTNAVPVARMSLANAELAKLAVNSFVTMKITFANLLARICETLPDGDVDVVTAAVGLDARIGRRYLSGATAYGGPCFPRDNIALAEAARRAGLEAHLPVATHTANRSEIDRLAALVLDHLPDDGRVAILGLSYKPDTDVVDESPGLLVAAALLERGVDVLAFDPVAGDSARRGVPGLTIAATAQAATLEADVVLLATPWEELRGLELDGERPRTVIDCWRLLDPDRLPPTTQYVALGLAAL